MSLTETVYRPSTNAAQEALRWLPAGVKHALLEARADQPIDHFPPWCIEYLSERELCMVMHKGPHKGHIKLTELGRKVHSANQRRFEGKE